MDAITQYEFLYRSPYKSLLPTTFPIIWGMWTILASSMMSSCIFRWIRMEISLLQYSDVIMGAVVSQITSLAIVYSTGEFPTKMASNAKNISIWWRHHENTRRDFSVRWQICEIWITSSKDQWLRGRLLTHWGRVTHICVSNLAIIGSDNGLSPGRRTAIIWTNAGILLIGPLGTNVSEISNQI